jgi:hypothetical protein
MARLCSFWARVKSLDKVVVQQLQRKEWDLKAVRERRLREEGILAYWYSCSLEERVFYWTGCPQNEVAEYLANCTPEKRTEYFEIFGK